MNVLLPVKLALIHIDYKVIDNYFPLARSKTTSKQINELIK